MLKRDLVDEITNNLDGFLKKDISQAVDIILQTMSESLDEGRRVEIRGFGSFSVRKRKARQTKNPKTGKIICFKCYYFLLFRHDIIYCLKSKGFIPLVKVNSRR